MPGYNILFGRHILYSLVFHVTWEGCEWMVLTEMEQLKKQNMVCKQCGINRSSRKLRIAAEVGTQSGPSNMGR